MKFWLYIENSWLEFTSNSFVNLHESSTKITHSSLWINSSTFDEIEVEGSSLFDL